MSKINLKIIGVIVLAAIVVITIALLQNPILKNDKSEPIVITVHAWPGYADIFIAQEKGFFEKNNVKVKIMFTPGIFESHELYLNGDADAIFQPYSDSILDNSLGAHSKVVYVMDISTTGDVIVGLGNSLSDLKGKTVGIVDIDGFSHIFVLSALKNSNLTEHDVKFKIVPGEHVLDELQSGQIAAGHTWEPTRSQAIESGYHILTTAAQTPGSIIDVLVFNSEMIQKRPDDVKAILKSISEATEYRMSHLDESIPIMARGENMTNDEMKSGLDGLHMMNLQDNYHIFTSSDSESLYGLGESISEFYINIGQLSELQDFNEILDPEFVEQMAKEKGVQ